MKDVILIVMKYWNNKKSVKRKFNEKNELIGCSFKDIDYGNLLLDEELIAIMKANEDTSELNFRHGCKGDRFKVKEDTKIVTKDFFFVGLDTRVEFTDVDAFFVAPTK